MQRLGIALLSYLIGHMPYQDLSALSHQRNKQTQRKTYITSEAHIKEVPYGSS